MLGEDLRKQLSEITSNDITMIERPAESSEQFASELRMLNPALWDYIRTSLETIAPQDTETKGKIVTFLGQILQFSESVANRKITEQLYQLPEAEQPLGAA